MKCKHCQWYAKDFCYENAHDSSEETEQCEDFKMIVGYSYTGRLRIKGVQKIEEDKSESLCADDYDVIIN